MRTLLIVGLASALALVTLAGAALLRAPSPPDSANAAASATRDAAHPRRAPPRPIASSLAPSTAARTPAPIDVLRTPDLGADGSGGPEARGVDEVATTQPPPLTLRVLDARDNTPLRQVELLKLSGIGSRPFPWPDHGPIVTAGDSPLSVPRPGDAQAEKYWVQAPGFARQRVALDFVAGGVREVSLEPACRLRIFVEAPAHHQTLILRLRTVQAGARSLARNAEETWNLARRRGEVPPPEVRILYGMALDLGDCTGDDPSPDPATMAWCTRAIPPDRERSAVPGDWVSFDHLLPGQWIVTLEEFQQDPAINTTLGHAVLALGAGETRSHRIPFVEPQPCPRVALSGTLLVPWAWRLYPEIRRRREALMTIEPSFPSGTPIEWTSAAPSLQRLDEELHVWTTSELVPGSYIVTVPKYRYRRRFELPPYPGTEWTIRVPPPCEVTLTTVDAGTGQQVEVEDLRYWLGDGGSGGWNLRSSTKEPGRYRLRAPQARLNLKAQSSSEQPWEGEAQFDLHAGKNELMFWVRRRK